MLHWKPPQAPVDTYDIRVTAPGGEQGWASGGDLLRVVRAEGRLRSGRAGKAEADGSAAASPAPAGLSPGQRRGPPPEWPGAPHQLHGHRARPPGPQPHLSSQHHLHHRYLPETCARRGEGRCWETQGLISIFSSSFPV